MVPDKKHTEEACLIKLPGQLLVILLIIMFSYIVKVVFTPHIPPPKKKKNSYFPTVGRVKNKSHVPKSINKPSGTVQSD